MNSLRTIPPTIFETFPRAAVSATRASLQTSNSTTTAAHRLYSPPPSTVSQSSFDQYKIENTSFPSAPGVNLSDSQKVITGSILDLFAGRPSLRKLQLWKDDASFADPLTVAQGRKQYQAQWYGLKTAFSNIERLGGQVTAGGNPIELDMKTRYVVKGIGKEQTVDSKVKIWTEGEGEDARVKRVEDRWNDQLPDSTFSNAMRNLSSVVVPTMVGVPKSIEEEESAQR